MAYFVGNRIAGFLSCFNQCIFDKINRAYDYHANLDCNVCGRSSWQHETILGILAAVCFALGLVCFVLFVMADKAEFKDTWIENEGLWQRLTLMCMYLPFVIVSIQELIK